MMPLCLSAHFALELDQACDALLQFEAAATAEQRILTAETSFSMGERIKRVAGEDRIGERVWLRAQGRLDVRYCAVLDVQRRVAHLNQLAAVPMVDLPAMAVPYLFDSRYCHPSEFVDFAAIQFGSIEGGGAQVAAIRDWVADHLKYAPGASGNATNATDTFHTGAGICRDYAHLLVTLARACAIPARYVACYAPGVTPQDFHAVAQVYLDDPASATGGAWHLVDATGMADPAQTAIIGVGRDAGDVSFVTSFGPMQFISSEIRVAMVDASPDSPMPEPGNDNIANAYQDQVTS